MATVFDVAAYILKQRGEITTMKLQKLVYYCQAWHLVWEDEPLFRERIFATATGHAVLTGWAMFGSLSFVPLFVQAVLGTNATQAGTTLSPMLLGWVVASIIGSRALLYMSYRNIALLGTVLLTLGAFLMTRANSEVTQLQLMINLGLMGVGMGFAVSPFLIAVQSHVGRRNMGAATSTLTFSRSIGGTLGVSIMGAVLSARLASRLSAAGIDPETVSLNSLLDPLARSEAATGLNDTLRNALGASIQSVFVIAFIASILALVVCLLAPGGRIIEAKPATATDPHAKPELSQVELS